MSDGGKGRQISDNLRTDDYISEKLGIGSGKQYEKEKYIVEKEVYFAYLKFLYSPTSGGKPVFPILGT